MAWLLVYWSPRDAVFRALRAPRSPVRFVALALEAVDALTADVAYRHTDGAAKGLVLVTAGHYHSRKTRWTDISADVVLRCYLTATGSASLEVCSARLIAL